MKPFSPLKPLIAAMFALAAATAQAQITFSPVNGEAYIWYAVGCVGSRQRDI